MLPFTDAKGRTWTVADMTALGEFGRTVDLGSDRACYRRFVFGAVVRHYAFRPGEDRATTPGRLRAQLRGSFGAGDRLRSSVEKIQDLYAARRGMGPR